MIFGEDRSYSCTWIPISNWSRGVDRALRNLSDSVKEGGRVIIDSVAGGICRSRPSDRVSVGLPFEISYG